MPRKKYGSVLAVVGAQYGSEGKGVIVHHLADRYDLHVRVGGPNAGHSFYHDHERYVQQSVPCGWTNPSATLVIGRGAILNPDILLEEVLAIAEHDTSIWDRLRVDGGAGILSHEHHSEEGGVHGLMHARIGSTGEGVGAARVARINREPGQFQHFRDVIRTPEYRYLAPLLEEDTPSLLAAAIQQGRSTLLEGTQGSGLSLVHGPWPYVTSHDTNAAQMAADAGIPPRFVNRVMLVARTHPIRVAGNSGPLSNEIDWADLSEELGFSVQERTTVTKKVRRIGRWDPALIDQAVVLNGPTSFALTFSDYLAPCDAGKTEFEELSQTTRTFVKYMESAWRVPVAMIGTGGPEWSVVDRGIRP